MKELTIQTLHEFASRNEMQLIPTHQILSVPIIKRIYAKMMINLKFADIQVCDNIIVNGHHRYISSLLASKTIGTIPALTTSATRTYDWPNVKFVTEDWDSSSEIEMHNRNDAQDNSISLQQLYEMIR